VVTPKWVLAFAPAGMRVKTPAPILVMAIRALVVGANRPENIVLVSSRPIVRTTAALAVLLLMVPPPLSDPIAVAVLR
jgi:hypothetical protein